MRDTKIEDVYINYEAFELLCYDFDGRHKGPIEIEISSGEARKICEAIGLMGFIVEDGKLQTLYSERKFLENNAPHLNILESPEGSA